LLKTKRILTVGTHYQYLGLLMFTLTSFGQWTPVFTTSDHVCTYPHVFMDDADR